MLKVTAEPPRLCSGIGQFHTDNPASQSPQPYSTISLSDVEDMVRSPQCVKKENARWLIPSSVLSRQAKTQTQEGRFYAVWCDFDEHAEQSAVEKILASLDCSYMLYSSRSATKDRLKWRVIIPLDENVNATQWQYLAEIINDKFEQAGITPDRASERVNQIFYLPNRGEYYSQSIELSKPFLNGLVSLSDELAAKEQHTEKQNTERLKIKEASRLKAVSRISNGTKSPVDAFNASYPVEQCLIGYGYGRIGNKFLSPNSESGKAGVVIKDGKWLSSHGSDSGIGKSTKTGSVGDAFDLFVFYECGGDFSRALLTAGNMFSADSGKTINQQNQQNYMKNADAPPPYNFTTNEKITATDHCTPSGEHVVHSYNNLQHLQHLQQNSILDGNSSYVKIDLLQYLDENSLVKKLSQQIARECKLPESTAFLNVLGIFSGISSRRWAIQYENGYSLPVGIYAIFEQPSGVGKSRCQRAAQAPFIDIQSAARKKHLKDLENAEKNEDEDALEELKKLSPNILGSAFTTNATPEGLENGLSASKGFFSAVSSEQGILNSLLGASYSSGSNNNDVLLSGFDGGYVSSSRVTRQGYAGHVIGTTICFAQQGSVETILKSSEGSGVSERFILLCEPHQIGTRNYLEKTFHDEELIENYAHKCEFFKDVLKSPEEFGDLHQLKINAEGWRLINEYRNWLEPELADGKKFSHISLRGAGCKIDMQIMKIAANLHILEREDDYNSTIPVKCVQASISICNQLLEANLTLCTVKGIIGVSAEFKAIISIFEKDARGKTERQLITSRSRVEPFKSTTGNKSKAIKETLAKLVDCRTLSVQVIGGVKTYFLNE